MRWVISPHRHHALKLDGEWIADWDELGWEFQITGSSTGSDENDTFRYKIGFLAPTPFVHLDRDNLSALYDQGTIRELPYNTNLSRNNTSGPYHPVPGLRTNGVEKQEP